VYSSIVCSQQIANDVCGKQSTFPIMAGQEFDLAEPVLLLLRYGSKSSLRFVLTIARSPRFSGSQRQKLAVQGRYKVNLFLCVLTGSLQGVAERPLPCSYNVIQQDLALSRQRPRAFFRGQ